MPQKELKYILTAKNPEGIGVIHEQAICHMAYATALDALGMSDYLTSEQIRKFAAKKTEFTRNETGICLDVRIPVRRDINMFDVMSKAQKDIEQSFSDFLSIKIQNINLIVDQVVV